MVLLSILRTPTNPRIKSLVINRNLTHTHITTTILPPTGSLHRTYFCHGSTKYLKKYQYCYHSKLTAASRSEHDAAWPEGQAQIWCVFSHAKNRWHVILGLQCCPLEHWLFFPLLSLSVIVVRLLHTPTESYYWQHAVLPTLLYTSVYQMLVSQRWRYAAASLRVYWMLKVCMMCRCFKKKRYRCL